MSSATVFEFNGMIAIRSPYNASLVQQIKSLPGRRWDSVERVWMVPVSQEAEAREIVRKFFQIEGEQSVLEYEVVRLRVFAKASAKRTYVGNVAIDGHSIINLYGGVRQNDSTFEVVSSKGGFTRGDGNHAFEVEYELALKVRKGANIERTGRADYWGSFEILDNAAPAPKARKRKSKELPADLAALQLPEGFKACKVRGQKSLVLSSKSIVVAAKAA